jgi:hypothetical protein
MRRANKSGMTEALECIISTEIVYDRLPYTFETPWKHQSGDPPNPKVGLELVSHIGPNSKRQM